MLDGRTTARAVRWILVPIPLVLVVLTASCAADGPDARVEACANSLRVEGFSKLNRYVDHDWRGMGYIGTRSADPVRSVAVTGPDTDLRLTPVDSIPNGPYVELAEGTLDSSKGNCRVSVQRLKEGLKPPAYLVVSASHIPAILDGREEVIVLKVGPGAD
ncbi:hypothetical protein NLX85_15120 [Micromonospora sp. A3M-1-15]|uniref:hypothetical protein n=1 Tax=Micromonospora sp. A3M-1-15 TaxID=2962035 RepID=UPI0020B8F4EA|nr:hypothetical protein [Micromonospora sp. A3M-1-15]MCP3784701.1 hypothetical protein [Micromonospora sp. A3M-1-15]